MDIEKSFPLSEGVVETENAGEKSGSPFCLNCETPLADRYCPHCGQKDIPARQTFGDMMMNFISSFWSFESKFFYTGKLLLFRPGKMASEYGEGKRERFFHPARMYVFISFVYFLFISVLPDGDAGEKENKKKTETTNEVRKGWTYDGTRVGSYKTVAGYDSIQRSIPAEQRDGPVMRWLNRRFAALNEKYQGKNQDFAAAFSENFMTNVPRVFFVLLPIFALLLKLLYVRRDYYFSEHLIFSVYYYNFFFLAGSLYMLVDLVPFLNNFTWVIGWWIVLYLLFGMKRMYHQSWRKTIFKYSLFLGLFTFCIILGLATNAFITFLII
jgi:hypothetical protein